jgi:lipoprotein-releasing system ATP-binding protein
VAFVDVQGLNKVYQLGAQRIHVLRDLELHVAYGEMVAIVGASGVGKSTLLHLLGGLDRADSGQIVVADTDLRALDDSSLVRFRNRNVGVGFQFHHLMPEFDATENVEMPLRVARESGNAARRRAVDLLSRVGLGERLKHRPSEMSGGEQQRVAVARAHPMKPALLLADEPPADLDETTADSLHELLKNMHAEQGLTSVIATHNPRLAAACNRVFRLERGQLHPE